MTNPPSIEYASDPQMCRQCRGHCCQGHPGVWVVPERFFRLFFAGEKLPKEKLELALPKLGLTLRNLDGVDVPAPMTGDNGCSQLGQDGCKLDESLRPCQCLALEPVIETLMTGENHCQLPAAAGLGRARGNWKEHWNPTRKG